MKRFTGYLIAAIVAIAAASAYAADSKPVIITPSSIKWMPGSGQIPSTVGVMVLEGNPMKGGPFTVRLRIPDGTKFPVHYHDDTERLTVLSGTFMAGIGTKWDSSKMVALTAGSYCVLPGGLRHYAMAKGLTIVQLSGTGPFAMKMDKPSM
jgi:hypothetical protein